MIGIAKYSKLTPEFMFEDSYYFMRLAEVYYIASRRKSLVSTH